MSKLGILCLALVLAMGSLGVGYAMWDKTLYIDGTVNTGSWEVGGTPGFWKDWGSHQTYEQSEIEEWLSSIDGVSDWLGPTSMAAMEAVFDDATGGGATMEQKFLAHYLATRLNVEAGRLYLGTTHDVIGISGYSYLGLATPLSATLTDIIAAIEDKYDEVSPPTEAQFEIMKNICDALNNLDI